MTILAHGLWAAAICKPIRKTNWKTAIFWATFPDVFWGIIFIPYLLVFKQQIPKDFSSAPWWLYHLYGFSHSFVIAVLAILLVFFLKKRFPKEMLAWPFLHILPDIPGHTYFKTPFFYPISNYSIHGWFGWDEPLPILISHLLPVLLLVFYLLGKKLQTRLKT